MLQYGLLGATLVHFSSHFAGLRALTSCPLMQYGGDWFRREHSERGVAGEILGFGHGWPPFAGMGLLLILIMRFSGLILRNRERRV